MPGTMSCQELMIAARSRSGYAHRDRKLARELVQAMELPSLVWQRVLAEFQRDGIGRPGILAPAIGMPGLTRTDHHRDPDSHFDAMARTYPSLPIVIHHTGLPLGEKDFDPRKLLKGFQYTRAYTCWAKFAARPHNRDQACGCLFHTARGGKDGGVIVHDLSRRSPAFDGATHFIKGRRIFIQAWMNFLETLSAIAADASDAAESAANAFKKWIVNRVAVGDHIDGLTAGGGGRSIGLIHRGMLLVDPSAMPPEMLSIRFLRRLREEGAIEYDVSRETYYFRSPVGGCSRWIRMRDDQLRALCALLPPEAGR